MTSNDPQLSIGHGKTTIFTLTTSEKPCWLCSPYRHSKDGQGNSYSIGFLRNEKQTICVLAVYCMSRSIHTRRIWVQCIIIVRWLLVSTSSTLSSSPFSWSTSSSVSLLSLSKTKVNRNTATANWTKTRFVATLIAILYVLTLYANHFGLCLAVAKLYWIRVESQAFPSLHPQTAFPVQSVVDGDVTAVRIHHLHFDHHQHDHFRDEILQPAGGLHSSTRHFEYGNLELKFLSSFVATHTRMYTKTP